MKGATSFLLGVKGLIPNFHTGGARGSGHTAVSTYDTDDMRPPSHVSNGSALSNPVTGGYHSQRAEGEAGGPTANSGAAPGKVAYNEKTMLLSSDDEFQWEEVGCFGGNTRYVVQCDGTCYLSDWWCLCK